VRLVKSAEEVADAGTQYVRGKRYSSLSVALRKAGTSEFFLFSEKDLYAFGVKKPSGCGAGLGLKSSVKGGYLAVRSSLAAFSRI
jgi:hypothetical protein